MDEAIRSILVERRLLSGTWRDYGVLSWLLPLVPCSFVKQYRLFSILVRSQPIHTMGMINLENYSMSHWYLYYSLY